MVTAYCVKCGRGNPDNGRNKEMKDAQEVAMKGKGGVERRAMKGKCPDCGTTMFRILGKKKE